MSGKTTEPMSALPFNSLPQHAVQETLISEA